MRAPPISPNATDRISWMRPVRGRPSGCRLGKSHTRTPRSSPPEMAMGMPLIQPDATDLTKSEWPLRCRPNKSLAE